MRRWQELSSTICISIVTHHRQLSAVIIHQYLFNTFSRDLKQTHFFFHSVSNDIPFTAVKHLNSFLLHRDFWIFVFLYFVNWKSIFDFEEQKKKKTEVITKLEIISGTSWDTLLKNELTTWASEEVKEEHILKEYWNHRLSESRSLFAQFSLTEMTITSIKKSLQSPNGSNVSKNMCKHGKHLLISTC
jgi:hypothetical protein